MAPAWRNQQMFNGLVGLNNLNIPVKTIVDVGAAAGTWTLLAKELWPACSYVLFEPLEERKGDLENLAASNDNIFIVPFAAGETDSEARFFVSNDLDGSGVAGNAVNTDEHIRVVKQTSIELEIKKLNLKGPYIIKLDTHGYEVPIIEGSAQIINEVSAFIIECYGFRIAESSLLFWEMCAYMNNLGFSLFNMVDLMSRPKDGAFWQCDAFFIRKEHPVFETNGYD